MCKSFMPTVRELIEDESGRWTTCDTFKQKRELVRECRRRIEAFRKVFPDTVDPNALARFLLAKEATGARLNRLIPAWAKTPPPPKPPKPWANQPPRFPHGLGHMNPAALHFHNRAA